MPLVPTQLVPTKPKGRPLRLPVTPLCLRSLQIQPDLLVATSITIIQCNPTFSPSSTSNKKRSPSSSTFLQLVSNDFSAHVLPPMSLFYLDDLMTLLSNYTVSQNSFRSIKKQ
jgi:hypothetical protein